VRDRAPQGTRQATLVRPTIRVTRVTRIEIRGYLNFLSNELLTGGT